MPLGRSIKHLPQPPSAAWTLEPAICVRLGVPNAATGLYFPRRSCFSAASRSFSDAERSMQQRPQPEAAYALDTAATEPPAAALRSTERPCARTSCSWVRHNCSPELLCARRNCSRPHMALQVAAPVLEATACEFHGSAQRQLTQLRQLAALTGFIGLGSAG